MAKRIGSIVSLSIIGILIVLTLIMVNVDKNYMISCNTPDYIYVQYGSNSKVVLTDDDQISAVQNYISNASKENLLTSLFSGNLFSKANITTAATGSNSISIPSTSDYYVVYHYDTAQVLKYSKNSVYKDSDGNKYYYKELTFDVTSTDDMISVTIYITPSTIDGNDVNTTVYTKYYTIQANFADLYDYLDTNLIGQ